MRAALERSQKLKSLSVTAKKVFALFGFVRTNTGEQRQPTHFHQSVKINQSLSECCLRLSPSLSFAHSSFTSCSSRMRYVTVIKMLYYHVLFFTLLFLLLLSYRRDSFFLLLFFCVRNVRRCRKQKYSAYREKCMLRAVDKHGKRNSEPDDFHNFKRENGDYFFFKIAFVLFALVLYLLT